MVDTEESCVRFHEAERVVKTASSEHVRQPIYTGALGKWRDYEKHLGIWIDEPGEIIDDLSESARSAAG